MATKKKPEADETLKRVGELQKESLLIGSGTNDEILYMSHLSETFPKIAESYEQMHSDIIGLRGRNKELEEELESSQKGNAILCSDQRKNIKDCCVMWEALIVKANNCKGTGARNHGVGLDIIHGKCCSIERKALSQVSDYSKSE